MESTFRLRFVIHAVEADDTLQKYVKLRVRLRILRDLKEWAEDIYNHSTLLRWMKSWNKKNLLMTISSNVLIAPVSLYT